MSATDDKNKTAVDAVARVLARQDGWTDWRNYREEAQEAIDAYTTALDRPAPSQGEMNFAEAFAANLPGVAWEKLRANILDGSCAVHSDCENWVATAALRAAGSLSTPASQPEPTGALRSQNDGLR